MLRPFQIDRLPVSFPGLVNSGIIPAKLQDDFTTSTVLLAIMEQPCGGNGLSEAFQKA